MKFNSQICTTKEQSERLLGLGLRKETADMGLAVDIPIAIEDWKTQDTTLIDSPAWSLHRLMELCPLLMDPPRFLTISQHRTCYTLFIDGTDISFGSKSTYDNIIDCIKWLIEKNYFNNIYLNE